jgi:CHRD domain
MSRRGRLGGILLVLALLGLVAAGLATADSSPPPKAATPAKPGKVRLVGQTQPARSTPRHPVMTNGYRLRAVLSAPGSTTVSGHWEAVLVHTVAVGHEGSLPTLQGCTFTGRPGNGQFPPRASGLPYMIKCGPVPPVSVTGNGRHWILAWRIFYSGLSSAVTGVDIRLNSPGTAGTLAATLCSSSCASGRYGRTIVTDDQAAAIVGGHGYVVVATAAAPGGEISGQIVRITQPQVHQ